MQRNWKYVLPVAVTTLGLFTSVVHADSTTDSAQMRNLENRVNALEQRKGAGGMINPQGRPQVRDGADVFVFADLLYWNAHENGLNVAVKTKASNTDDTLLDDSSVLNVRGKWNWGFRTGLGYNTMHDGWDLKLTWLRFTDTGHKRGSIETNTVYYPTQLAGTEQFDDITSTKAHGYWGFNLNQLDLEMGREFFVSKWLTLRPHVGLRTDWIHQNFESFYDHVSGSIGVDAAESELKDHWWGLGLAGGLDSQWGLGNGWSIFGNAAASIVYGFHQIHSEQASLSATDVETTYMDLDQTFHMSRPTLDLAMGLRWDHMFCKDRFHIGFDLGWEHHIYFSQNQFPLFTNDASGAGIFASNQGDLTLQGWTFAARFDF